MGGGSMEGGSMKDDSMGGGAMKNESSGNGSMKNESSGNGSMKNEMGDGSGLGAGSTGAGPTGPAPLEAERLDLVLLGGGPGGDLSGANLGTGGVVDLHARSLRRRRPGKRGRAALACPRNIRVNAIAAEIKLDETALSELEASFRGQLVRPGGSRPTTSTARSGTGRSIAFPALIARCAGVADVIAAVRFAREHRPRGRGPRRRPQLPRAVGLRRRHRHRPRADEGDPRRSGGAHGAGPGGRAARANSIVRRRRSGSRRPGRDRHPHRARGADARRRHRLAQRKHGLTIDQLLSRRPRHRRRRVREGQRDREPRPLLGRARRRRQLRHRHRVRVPPEPGGPDRGRRAGLLADGGRAEVLRFYRDWIADAPDELMTIVVQRKAPALPVRAPGAARQAGRRASSCCYAGPVEDGEGVVRPLKSFGSPVLDLCEPKPYLAHQAMFDPSFRHGCWYYVRSCDVAELTDDVIDITVEHCAADRLAAHEHSRSGRWEVRSPASARTRPPSTDAAPASPSTSTATARRPKASTRSANGPAAYWSALEPYHTSVYVNFLMDEGEERIRQAYGAEKYDRLKALKRKYDPTTSSGSTRTSRRSRAAMSRS